MTASTPSNGASALHNASNAVRPHPRLGPSGVSADANQRRFMRISRHWTENAEHSRRSWRTRRLVGAMGPRQYRWVAIARRGRARKCAANQRDTALERWILVRPSTVAQTAASALARAVRMGHQFPIARCRARSRFYPAFISMITPQVAVRREKNRLLCGVVSCDGVVGRLAVDASGWPRAILTVAACPRCGRDQTLSFAKLEADTQAQYVRG